MDMDSIKIRTYKSSDETQVINLWNQCLTKDPVSTEIYHKKILLDPNFDPDLCLIAVDENDSIVGYCWGIVRKYPYGNRGTEPERGWIPVMFVHPNYQRKGIGSSLMKILHEKFDKLERTNITLGAYSPNYFFPGPDKDAYSDSIPFFESFSYEVMGEAVGMDMVLYNLTIPKEIQDIRINLVEEHGIRIIPFSKEYTLPLIEFLEENFSGGWARNVRETLKQFKGEERILLAVDEDANILGYCQRAIDDLEGHYGPFGVSEEMRGKKLGSVLFYEMLWDMYSRGIYHVWVAWTNGGAQRFYERAGMRVIKRHAVMKRFK